ncbi:MAG: T9SS type A sorting domain-containing protein [Bacteroidia bacterium]|nr:T9SS type A sorting domain-containing protein [Bacteroidia bacterium]
MMRSICFALVFCISVVGQSVFAQVPDYTWAVKGTQLGSFAFPIKTSFDEQGKAYLLLRYTEPLAFGSISLPKTVEHNLAVVCFDTTGHALWAATSNSPDGLVANDMTIDRSGNIIIAGWYTNTMTLGALNLTFQETDTQKQKQEFFIAQLNPAGQWQWARKQSGIAYSEIKALDTDQNGNIIAGGEFFGSTLTIGDDSLSPEEELPFVIKYTPAGWPLWLRGAQTLYGASLNDVICLPGGLICYTGSFGTFDTDAIEISFEQLTLNNVGNEESGFTTSDLYIATLDSSGNYLWAKNAGATDYESFAGALAADQSKVYVCGTFQEQIVAAGTSFSESATGEEGDIDLFVGALDFNGNWQWLIGAGTAEEDGMPSLTTSNGQYIYVYGELVTDAFTLGSFELENTLEHDSYLARLNEDGTWNWAFTFPQFMNVASKSGNQFLFTGTFADSVSFGEHTLYVSGAEDVDMYLCAMTYGDPIPQGITPTPEGSGLAVYPLPFDQYFILKAQEIGQWHIFNLQGQSIAKGSTPSATDYIQWDSQNPAGMYLLQFKTATGKVYTKKLLKN